MPDNIFKKNKDEPVRERENKIVSLIEMHASEYDWINCILKLNINKYYTNIFLAKIKFFSLFFILNFILT